MRAFIAIKLPPDIKNALTGIQDKLKPNLPKLNWIKPTNLHLSLKFLGEISEQQLQSSQQIIARIIKTALPFEIKLETLGVFPDDRQARIIWIGTTQPPAQLKQSVEQLENEFLGSSIPREQRSFQAHITLGRIKNPINHADLEKAINDLKSGITDMNLKFNFQGMALFQSVLGPGGPAYSILKEEFLK